MRNERPVWTNRPLDLDVKRFRGGNEGSQYTNHDGSASPWHLDGAGSLPEGQGGADEGRKN